MSASESSTLIVSLSTRYSAAWSEINSRIEARQQVFLYCVLTSVTAASATVVVLVTENAAESGRLLWLYGLSVALLFLYWAFVLSIRHHETIIGLLGRFCAECERQSPLSPAWHSDKNWVGGALEARAYSDLAFSLAVLLGASPSCVLVYLHLRDGRYGVAALATALTLSTVGAAGFALFHRWLRALPPDATPIEQAKAPFPDEEPSSA
jgi:hypothetical protein